MKTISWTSSELVIRSDLLPSLKLTAKAPENGWLEYKPFLLGRPIFRGYVSFREGMMEGFDELTFNPRHGTVVTITGTNHYQK